MGMMNMIGNGGGAILQTLFVHFVEIMKSRGYTDRARWDLAVSIYVAVALLGMALWTKVDPALIVSNGGGEAVPPEQAS